MATAAEIARWMLGEFERKGRLVQYEAANHIHDHYGEEFVYENDNGNWAIKKDILAAFRKLTPEGVVWSRGYQEWRRREDDDPPGKRMVD